MCGCGLTCHSMNPIDAPASGHWLSFYFSLQPTLEGQFRTSQLQILAVKKKTNQSHAKPHLWINLETGLPAWPVHESLPSSPAPCLSTMHPPRCWISPLNLSYYYLSVNPLTRMQQEPHCDPQSRDTGRINIMAADAAVALPSFLSSFFIQLTSSNGCATHSQNVNKSGPYPHGQLFRPTSNILNTRSCC